MARCHFSIRVGDRSWRSEEIIYIKKSRITPFIAIIIVVVVVVVSKLVEMGLAKHLRRFGLTDTAHSECDSEEQTPQKFYRPARI